MLMGLALAPGRVAIFRVQEMRAKRAISGQTIFASFPQYLERVDEKQAIILPACRDMPLTFHACITAASRLLFLIHSRPQVYEDDVDFTIDPKQLVQSVANVYGVDPNEMMAHYPTARRYLSHKELQHPLTIEAGLTALQSRATSTTTIKRFH